MIIYSNFNRKNIKFLVVGLYLCTLILPITTFGKDYFPFENTKKMKTMPLSKSCSKEIKGSWDQKYLKRAQDLYMQEKYSQAIVVLKKIEACYLQNYQNAINKFDIFGRHRRVARAYYVRMIGLMAASNVKTKNFKVARKYAEEQVHFQQIEGLVDSDYLIGACNILAIVNAKYESNPYRFIKALNKCYNSTKNLKTLSKEDEQIIQSFSYNLAAMHSALGEKEKAFKWLKMALSQDSMWVKLAQKNQNFDGIRQDPRFIELIKKYSK